MKTSALLAALDSGDLPRIRDALEAAEERLRDRDFDDDELEALAQRLEKLGAHDMADVRRAVARVCRFMRHKVAHTLVQQLCADKDMQVVKAAERTRELRSERAKIELLPEVLDGRMQRELTDLENRHNAKTRQAAMRVGMRYGEFMVSALYHQSRNTLMPLDMTLQMLDELTRGTPLNALVQTARAQNEQVKKVMSNAREFARVDLPGYERVVIGDVVARALADVRTHPTAIKNGFEAAVDVDGALVVEGIGSRLYEALLNLLKNAVEASEERTPILVHLTAKRSKGRVVVTVRDEGCGMDEQQYASDIWRPYGSRKLTGTGLGMPIVKKIVVLEHHGAIDIASKKGEGTTVTLTLPVEQEF